MTPERLSVLVRQRALELRFDAVGISTLEPTPHAEQLKRWINSGMAGAMTYMHRQLERRLRPGEILPGAHRAVVVTKHYLTPDPDLRTGKGRVAKYARGRDYHQALAAPLEQLASYIQSLGSRDTLARAYCDAGPIPERELAQRAGLGWIGKNTMLIDPRRGSFSFIAVILTSLDLAVDTPFEEDRCGTCRLCLDACPTGAFPEERVLDSRKCISYLTIEYQGNLDEQRGAAIGDWVFGCDVCQDVCPWNVKFAESPGDDVLESEPGLALLDLDELAALSDQEFQKRYGHTALTRAGARSMRRNAQLARRNQSRR